MVVQPGDLSWLPDHQQHVVFTLAHADQLIAQAGEILFGYSRSGPIALTSVADGNLVHLTASEIAPPTG